VQWHDKNEIMSDEKEQEKDTPSEPSTDETTEENVTEDANKSEEPMIPKARFDEVNKRMKEAEARVPKESAPKQEVKVEEKSNVSERLDAVEFMAKNRSFDAEDYEAANAIAKGRGVTLEEAIKDNLFIAMQEKKESTKAVDEATPTGGRSPKVAPPKPIEELTRDEHMDHFKKVLNG